MRFPTLIFANIALILGAVSVKKVVKKQKARFGIVAGLIWVVLLLSFIGWLVLDKYCDGQVKLGDTPIMVDTSFSEAF